jgi:hypothetical protein
MHVFQRNGLVGPHSGIRQSINHQWLHDSLTLIPVQAFWALQTSIVTQLHAIRSLSLFVAFVHPDHDSCSILHFVNDLSQTGWVTLLMHMDFTNYGNRVVGHTTLIVGIHNSTELLVEKFQFKTPPSKWPLHLNSFLWWNFNKVECGISYGHEDDDFEKKPYMGFTASLPSLTISTFIPDSIKLLYFIHSDGSDTSILAGAMVISWDSLCPLSPVHLTVTSSNPTLVSNSLSMASNMCANSPHLSTLLATASRIAFVINCPIGIIGMPLTLASRQ